MLPYPLLALSLILMWLLLNGFTFGQLVLGIIVAVFASWGMASLRPETPRLRKWYLLPKLFFRVVFDVAKSNLEVAWIILRGRSRKTNPGFVVLELRVRDQISLALLAIILTSTPGSAWLEYDSNDNTVLLHVLDLENEAQWRDMVANRYENLLMEIFA
ncbi:MULTISPECIES: Na+/H+ antiporter subunit E [unclassified Rhizobium]|uniref:Na+/H+ antiporter subunit E n=1 Tax=unclassified Rhizobium TaxID=2613769 RepID=UPI000EA9F3F3|nr:MULTISPECIES: Na+/H+ antiporter subunit E [unclassified Rhizobium]AYG69105.1 Na+/H+ antiporter subunit E [Rhizobium sp. CCGE531]AYG75485.1 Na+/H+ antiporter subunit E [Rhizobium sp. CCGE532]